MTEKLRGLIIILEVVAMPPEGSPVPQEKLSSSKQAWEDPAIVARELKLSVDPQDPIFRQNCTDFFDMVVKPAKVTEHLPALFEGFLKDK